jgi:hypothetical protein
MCVFLKNWFRARPFKLAQQATDSDHETRFLFLYNLRAAVEIDRVSRKYVTWLHALCNYNG